MASFVRTVALVRGRWPAPVAGSQHYRARNSEWPVHALGRRREHDARGRHGREGRNHVKCKAHMRRATSRILAEYQVAKQRRLRHTHTHACRESTLSASRQSAAPCSIARFEFRPEAEFSVRQLWWRREHSEEPLVAAAQAGRQEEARREEDHNQQNGQRNLPRRHAFLDGRSFCRRAFGGTFRRRRPLRAPCAWARFGCWLAALL